MPAPRAAWAMLLAFTAGFAMSQAFRTVAAIMAPPLQRELGLSPQQLGVFAGAFHFAFGGLQLVMGLGMDVHGPRRTVLAVAPLTIAGALLAAFAPDFRVLLLAQALIGIGCAPAFVACTVFIAHSFPGERFAATSGLVMGVSSVGLLLTGTPLAWLIERASWRTGYLALALGAALAWLAVWLLVREAPAGHGRRIGWIDALRGYGDVFRQRHTWGIVGLSLVTYAAFLALRGLWLGPLLVDRHGFGLLAVGHVALAVSVCGLLGPPLFGRFDPGDRTRRRWITVWTLAFVAMFAVLAASRSAPLDVVLILVSSLASGYIVLQYADVRIAYPPQLTGRAMAVFTMAMFLGVALMQTITGWVAAMAADAGHEPYEWVFGTIAVLVVIGLGAFVLLPAPAPVRR